MRVFCTTFTNKSSVYRKHYLLSISILGNSRYIKISSTYSTREIHFALSSPYSRHILAISSRVYKNSRLNLARILDNYSSHLNVFFISSKDWKPQHFGMQHQTNCSSSLSLCSKPCKKKKRTIKSSIKNQKEKQ